jgi:phenylalanyl-tRNA synthetase beta subunit
MKINLNWIKEYFNSNLPEVDEMSRILSNYAYEVEFVTKSEKGDDILEIDILPNRAADSLCHRGVAKEVATLLDVEMKERNISTPGESTATLNVVIANNNKCRRYVGRKIFFVDIKESPEWLKNKLISIDQRPINNIVDILNFTMFDMGQPMHAFDADKVKGNIVIRDAKEGEEIVTLDEKSITLSVDDLVIADDLGPIAIAGVKGGKRAEVTNSTRNIILESASFNPSAVRRTSRRLQIITDASKRYENNFSAQKAGDAMLLASSLILEECSTTGTKFEASVDVYPVAKKPYILGVSLNEVNSVLGTNLNTDAVSDILKRAYFEPKIIDPEVELTAIAKSLIGKPYKYGASVSFDAPNYFDCSSFVAYVYSQIGHSIPRITIDQFVFSDIVEKEQLKIGDIVFSQTSKDDSINTFQLRQIDQKIVDSQTRIEQKEVYLKSIEFMPGTEIEEGISHNGIYLGDGKIIHASGFWHKGEVVIEDLATSPAFSNVRGYGRILDGNDRFVVTVPVERADIKIKEDLIEEVGRIYGLNNIKASLPKLSLVPKINNMLLFQEHLKDTLMSNGYDEISTYPFAKDGSLEILNPLSKELPYLRKTLLDHIEVAVINNLKNIELIGVEMIKIFEIAKLFNHEGEFYALSIAVATQSKKSSAIIKEEIERLTALLKTECGLVDAKTIEIDNGIIIEYIIDDIRREGDTYDWKRMQITSSFSSISAYPYILRDVSAWTNKEDDRKVLERIIESRAGTLLKQIKLFDRFEKEGRISLAYHLVFQANDRTLTDSEINIIMNLIYKDMADNKFEIR